MAITILEIAPLLHSLFGVALWLIIINAICLVLAVRFEKIGNAMDALPADSVSYRDKIRMLCLYDKVLSGIGLRLAFSLISKNPFKLHLAQPKRLFRSLSEQDEDMLLRSMTTALLLRSPLACLLALALYALTFAGVFVVLLIFSIVASNHEQPRLSALPTTFIAHAKSGLQKAAREIDKPMIQVVT